VGVSWQTPQKRPQRPQTERMNAMEVYSNAAPPTTGVGPRPVIREAKEKVPTIDLADLLCGPGQMRRNGERWEARCPLPDHEDRTPSFVVYPGDRGWFCYGCDRGGDVITLARLAWGIERADEAAGHLLLEFGHAVPERPPAWFRKQERQKRVRDAVEEAIVERLQARVFKYLLLPQLPPIEDPDYRAHEIDRAWDSALPIARLMRAKTLSERGSR
jgi:hypothetical protein